jgi:hypothetical protein
MERHISGHAYDHHKLIRQLEKARALADQREWPAVREQLVGVRAALAKADIASGYVTWFAAVAADHTGELVEAAELIREAGRIDPLNPETARSSKIILDRVRQALTNPERPTAETAKSLYQALLDANQADRDSHVAAAHVYLAAGNREAAGRIADGLVALHRTWPPAWSLRIAVAEGLGDEQVLARVRSQAAEALASIDSGNAPALVAGRRN